MMRLVYINKVKMDSPTPGANFTLFNAYGLAQAGAECHLIVQKRSADFTANNLYERFNLEPLPNLHLHLISSRKYLKIKTNQWFYIQAMNQIKAINRRANPDAIITRDPSALPYISWLNFRFGIPVFYQPHNFYADWRIKPMVRVDNHFKYYLLEKVFIPRMSGLLCLQNSQAELYRRYFPKQNIFPSEPGLIACQENPANRYDAKLIGYVGNLKLIKGIFTLLKAFQILQPLGFKLVLIGGRNQKEIEQVTTLLTELDLTNKVTITGWIHYREVADYLDQISVGVIPLDDVFYNRYLTAPNKLFDYLSRGIPIVASDLPAINDFIRHEREGQLFPPEDADALAQSIIKLFQDPAHYHRCCQNSLKTGEKYLWEKRGKVMLEIIAKNTPHPVNNFPIEFSQD